MLYARASYICIITRAINKRARNIWQIARRKKIEKNLNTPLRISADCDRLVALTAQEGETDIAPSIAGKQAHMERAVN